MGDVKTLKKGWISNGIIRCEKCKKDLHYPVWRESGRGAPECEFFCRAKRVCRDHGRERIGKTTLLNILAALDKPTGGKVYLKGRDLAGIKEKEMAAFRRQNLGFVFQDFNLLDTFSIEDNILLPLVLSGRKYPEMEKRITPVVEKLRIADILKKYPYEVSGGQKQRAAVARALITKPQLILADEPTGALDSTAADGLLALFEELNRDGQTILMVTHSIKAASTANRVLFIKDGEVFHQLYRGNLSNEQMYQKISDTLTVLEAGGDE